MKQRNGDELIREKTESLSTLEGGIVFGKGEAWDKLQARMDRKSAVKISARYWVAAAAVLLVMIGGVAVYYHTGKEITKSKVDEQVTEPLPNAARVQPEPVINPQEPERVAITGISNMAGNHKKQVVVISEKDTVSQPEISSIQPVPAPVIEMKANDIVADVPPTPPVRQTMKVVHINEIENNELVSGRRTITGADATTKTDMRNLPLVHINEIERQIFEYKNILNGNRNKLVRNFFPKPFYHDIDTNSEDQIESKNPLKNLFYPHNISNIQN